MTKLFLFILLLFLIYPSFGQSPLDGHYQGVAPTTYDRLGGTERALADALPPGQVFYKVSYLKIKGNTAWLDNCSMAVLHGDTTYIKSDGIFEYFDGTFTQTDSVLHFHLHEVVVNYFEQTFRQDDHGMPILIRRENELVGKATEEGILIGSILFQRKMQLKEMVSYDKSQLIK